MANSTAICTSFKVDLFNGYHAFSAAYRTADTFKAALYLTTGSIGAGTTAYSATNEVSGSGYSAGGIAVTNATAPTSSGTTGYWTPSAALVYSTVTLTTAFDTVLVYNSTQSNKSVLSFNFGSTTITAGTLTLNMPANAAGTALISLS